MNPESFKYIGDILDSIERINSHLEETKSFSEKEQIKKRLLDCDIFSFMIII